jgi:diadenylate cyclase
LGVLVLAYLVSVWAGLELLRTILSNLATYAGFALIVVFQSEIRRMLARIGRRGSFGLRTRLRSRESTDEILLALGRLSERHVGGLIVLERDIGLRTFIESGVLIDAAQSRDLLLTIFEPGTALHDGAVIVQRDRIVAAACFLPLSMNPTLSRKLGTRHRAAIGVTEETDCLSLVVSEETGRISVAAFGEIEMDVSLKRAGERIMQHFGRRWPAWSHGAGGSKPAKVERGVKDEEEWREAQE